MKRITEDLEYLVNRYWLHYYPELTGRKWTSNEVKSDEEIILNFLTNPERQLLRDGLLMLNKVNVRSYGGVRRFLHFEWRLEVSAYGASIVEPRCAMDLIFRLGEIRQSAERGPLPACGRIAFRSRPSDFVLARIMMHIPKEELPELLAHDDEFFRQLATQRLMDTADEGARVYQYRYNGRGAGSFC